MMRSAWGKRIAALALLACLLGAAAPQPNLGLAIFPADNPWNWDISGFAVHPYSDAYINAIGRGSHLREDYAFYYSVVDDSVLPVDIPFNLYGSESDVGPGFNSGAAGSGGTGHYPFPSTAQIEGDGVGDAHVLVIKNGTTSKLLYETYRTAYSGGNWSAGCGAIFDLTSNVPRPEGWTSGDAAGLPIFPGLIRFDQATTLNGINHALRFTAPNTQNAHIYPARHDAGDPDVNLPPMGLRVRLKATVDLSSYSGAALEILKALKKHGMILADNGSRWYVSTTDDTRWNPGPGIPGTTIMDIRDMTGDDFEVVVSVKPDGSPVLTVNNGGTGPPPPPPPTGTPFGGSGGCGLIGMEAVLLLYFFGFCTGQGSTPTRRAQASH